MKIAVAGDSVGVTLADLIIPHLRAYSRIVVTNMSPSENSGEFYADVAERVGNAILAGDFDRGILCCGTGIGMAMSANKVPGIRAAQTHDTFSAVRAAKSNNAHIITLGSRVVGSELAKSIVDAWLAAEFDPHGPSASNVAAMVKLDEKYKRTGLGNLQRM